MTRATWAFFASAVTLVACGKTARLGDEKIHPGGVGGTAGTQGNAASGSFADAGGGQAGVSGASSGGEAGASGARGGSSGAGGATALDAGACKAPRPPEPAPNQTAAERERAELVHAFCQNLGDHNCIDRYQSTTGISAQASGCGSADKVRACEMDELYLYLVGIPPECDDEWRAALSCGARPEHAQTCKPPVSLVAQISEPGLGPGPCEAERLALEKCWSTNPDIMPKRVTGTRTSCDYSSGPSRVGSCQVTCRMPGSTRDLFHTSCTELPGLPPECLCMINGAILIDYGSSVPSNATFFASDCQHAAQLMADGLCVNRLDCCFTETHRLTGETICNCTSDPSYPQLGYASCEALAMARGGQVVDICPKYSSQINQ